MFEKRHQPLASKKVFFSRLLRALWMGFLLIAAAQGIGMMGYHHFEHMSWLDAFVNAAMILSGMGPLGPLTYTAGKIFAGCYALFSGLTFILVIGIVFSPLVHRLFHAFQVDRK
jgi:hypothetical protein